MSQEGLITELGLEEQSIREEASQRLKEAVEALMLDTDSPDAPSDFNDYNFSQHSQN